MATCNKPLIFSLKLILNMNFEFSKLGLQQSNYLTREKKLDNKSSFFVSLIETLPFYPNFYVICMLLKLLFVPK